MCSPMAIAGVAMTIGSTVANTMAQSKIRKARDQALAAERVRQRGFDQEADALNVQSQGRYEDFGGNQEDRAGELTKMFTEQKIEGAGANEAAAAEQQSALPQSSSNLTVREEGKQRGLADAFTDKQGAALGNLRAFGDLLGETGLGQARDASQIGQIGGFKRGSANVLPLELDQAQNAGNGLKTFADILGLAGQGATGFGLQGKFVPPGSIDPWAGKRTATLYNMYN